MTQHADNLDEPSGNSGTLPQPLENFEQLPDAQPRQDELREKLWFIKYGQPITGKDLRGIDHYPYAYRDFINMEAAVKALINSEALALLERLEKQAIYGHLAVPDCTSFIPATAVQQEKDAIIGKERS